MAGQIKKGFFFYFGMFILLLVTIFLICVVIMIFNPDSTVLWMQYFTGNTTYKVTKTSGDDGKEIDWNTITDIKIVVPSYAKVTVERNSNTDYKDSGIYIRNYAKGIRGAAGAVKFGYEVTQTNSSLTLTVSEPNGFLFFSKDLEVVLHASTLKNTNASFSNVNLIIQGGDGKISIGGDGLHAAAEVRLSSLYALTKSGDILVTENFNPLNLKNNVKLTGVDTPLHLETSSGNIRAYRGVEYNFNEKNIKNTGILLPDTCDNARFQTDKGKIYINSIISSKDVNLICKNGVVVSDFIRAKYLNINCTHGNYSFGIVDGNIDFSKSEDNIISPNVMIDYVSGDFTLSTEEGNQGEPDVDVGEIKGNVVIVADRGKINIHKAHGGVSIRSRNDMKINVIIAKDNSNDIVLQNISAQTVLGFIGNVHNTTKLYSVSGKIIINVTSQADFTSNAYNLKEGQTATEDTESPIEAKRISVNNFGGIADDKKNPFVRGNGIGEMIIGTNSSVEFNLVNETALSK